jgi:hypothetical protein
MWPVFRSILAVVLGFLLASIVMLAVEYAGHLLFTPPGLDLRDPEVLKTAFINAPLGAQLFVLLAWVLGSLAGGWLAAWISGRVADALVLGAILLAAGIYNMVTIPSPLWFWVVGVALFLPCAYAGAKLAKMRWRPVT